MATGMPKPVKYQLLIRWQLGRELVEGPVTHKMYVFTTINNVCGAEVDEADIAKLSEQPAACCGHVYSRPKFHGPSAKETKRWYRL
jgi:hypothetical protein